MRCFLLVLLLVLVLAPTGILADEKTAAEEPAKPLTTVQAADAVLRAVKAKDQSSLKALAEKDNPDPWNVADELCFRGEHDAAEAFAKAAPRADAEGLPAYVASRRGKAPDKQDRERLAAAIAAARSGEPQEALERVGKPGAVPTDTVCGAMLLSVRAEMLQGLGRAQDTRAAYAAVADAAEKLGWLSHAVHAHRNAGLSAFHLRALELARTSWARALALSERRGDRLMAAEMLANLGLAYHGQGDHATSLSYNKRALAAQEALGDKAGQAATLVNIGVVYESLGEAAMAGSSYERGLALAEEVGHLQGATNALDSLAAHHRRLAENDKALSYLQRALKARRALGDRHGMARTLGAMAQTQDHLGDSLGALSSHAQALEILEALGDKNGIAANLIDAGSSHARLGNYDKALACYERGIPLAEALGRRGWVANALNGIASVHKARAEYPQALSIYERALEEARASGNKQGAATMLSNIGGVYGCQGDYTKALSIYERALAVHEALGDKRGVARTLSNIGTAHHALGDYAKALSIFERVLADHEARGDRAAAALVVGNIAVCYSALGDHAKALSTLERSLAAREAIGDKHGVALVRANLGTTYESIGEFAKALAMCRRALTSMEALGDKSGAANARSAIGGVYFSMGDHAKALSHMERALAEQQSIGDGRGAATTSATIALVHSALGDYDTALASYDKVLAVMEAGEDKHGMALVLGNIGIAHEERGEHAEALSIFHRVLEALEALGTKQEIARTLGNIGTAQMSLGQFDEALASFERSRDAQAALGDRPGVALQLLNIGDLHHRRGDYVKARAFVEKSARAAESLRATELFVNAKALLARIHLDAGKPSRALRAAADALKAIERLLGGLGEELGATARAQHADLFAIGTLAATRDEAPAEALKFLESGRAGALLDSLDKREALRWKAETLSPELRRLDLEARAAHGAARNAYDVAARRDDLKATRLAGKALDKASDAVRAVADRIQRELKQQPGLFYPRAKTIEEIESSLQAGQVLVLYGLCLEEALALVLRPDGERVVALGKLAALTAACEALDATDATGDPTAALKTLRKLIVEPLKLGKDVTQVLISPEGPLCYLPFGALFEQTVAMTPSGTTHVLLLGEERQPGEGILALGAPDYGGVSKGAQAVYYRGRTLSPLPASRVEVEAIGTKRLLGAKASEPGLREAISAVKRWRAVHFACHGLVDIERPMLSSLALSRAGEDDGFLTALELLRTELPADLAVLSACETATGRIVKGEGIVGLTRAFMFAGAPRVICSLWKVDDEATRALMIKFYELWNPKDGKKGLGCAAALKKAQEYVRDHLDKNGKRHWEHPYYWAAWVLWGLPD